MRTVIWAVLRSHTDSVPLLFPTTKWSPRTSNSVTYQSGRNTNECSNPMFIEQRRRWMLHLKLLLTSFFSKFSQELVNSNFAPHLAISVTIQDTLITYILQHYWWHDILQHYETTSFCSTWIILSVTRLQRLHPANKTCITRTKCLKNFQWYIDPTDLIQRLRKSLRSKSFQWEGF